jgi:hypothetical protein
MYTESIAELLTVPLPLRSRESIAEAVTVAVPPLDTDATSTPASEMAPVGADTLAIELTELEMPSMMTGPVALTVTFSG